MYYSGIDQHKRDCLITTYDDAGQHVKQQRVLSRLRRGGFTRNGIVSAAIGTRPCCRMLLLRR